MMGALWERFSGSHRLAEFLPDAEGVIERRHSPVAGLLIVAVALTFCGMLAWSALTEIEQVVRADGQVEPADRVKVINHPDGGRIAVINVAEGQQVAAGTPLMSFDGEEMQAKLVELTGRWQLKSAEAARLEAEASGGDLRDAELAATRPDLLAEQQALLASRRDAHESRIEALAQAIQQRENEVQSAAADLQRLRSGHALLKEQVVAIRGLADKGLYPRLRLIAVERQLSDLAGDVQKAGARREAAEAALAEAKSRHQALERERRSTVLAELAAARAERDQLAETRRRQATALRNLVVRAPVDGIVQDISVTSPGQSVGSTEPLMKLVPTGGGLVVEARVQNRDIGDVRVGQPVKVKVHAYDFLRYGTLAGKIEQIDADAVVDPKTGALTYGIVVRTESAELALDQAKVKVVPGMAVDVDLMVGERTVLSYLTDRIFRLRAAAFREG
jgi:adhesin transport system membrane fusion protein